MNLSHIDQIFRPVHITIGNIDAKIHQSQNRLGTLLLTFKPIVHRQSEDSKNQSRDLKAKIYYLALKTRF